MYGLVARAAALAVIAAASTTVAAAKTRAQTIDWGLLQQSPNFIDSYTRGYELGRRLAVERAAARTPQAAQPQAERNGEQQRQRRARSAGRMIADGKCQDARSYALTEGDLDLALQVARLCPYAPVK